ncbi:MAG: hypothetical protein BWZ10_01623 [candidate division BRC1 bacterium ADurb.BinA364]|nr:MAG: hypothetical protein BWZ10_01623 [candidate division BRC1 bacterium ADurb.BinA364]
MAAPADLLELARGFWRAATGLIGAAPAADRPSTPSLLGEAAKSLQQASEGLAAAIHERRHALLALLILFAVAIRIMRDWIAEMNESDR